MGIPSNMACTSTFTLATNDTHDTHDTPPETETDADATGIQLQHRQPTRRRRHSHFIPRRKSIVNHIMDSEEGILLKVRSKNRSPPTFPLSSSFHS